MDGGSTDNTVKILKDTEAKLKKNQKITFYWQSKKDAGQSDAINQALQKTTGDIIAYINSDDYYLPGAFQKVANIFLKQNRLWLIGQSRIVNEKDQEIQKLIKIYKNIWLKFYSYSTLLILNYVTQPAAFWSPELNKTYGKFDTNMHLAMDYDFWLTIGDKYKPSIINSELATFRIHSNSKGKINYISQFQEDYSIASSHTHNNLLKYLHRIHNNLIIYIYKLIK